MVDFDISGWVPHWASAPEELNLQRANLLDCLGHQIVDSWIVWNLELDIWFADLPVVLRLDDGRQLEVSWQKLDDLSITWDTIDVSIAPVAWVTWPLEWRSQGHEALRAVTGFTIKAMASTESLLTTQQVRPATSLDNRGHSVLLVNGLWIETDGASLHVFNALDETGLANKLDEGDRLTPL